MSADEGGGWGTHGGDIELERWPVFTDNETNIKTTAARNKAPHAEPAQHPDCRT